MAKQPDQEDQPNVAGGSTSYVVTAATTEPREEGANVSASANLTANVNLGAEETQEDEPREANLITTTTIVEVEGDVEEDDDAADDHPTCSSSSSLPAARDGGGEVAAVVPRPPAGWTSQQWRKGDVDNVFLDLKELAQGTDAESIYNSLREALRDAGFDDEFLFINLISIATDGASVLTGKNSGVIARLKQDFPKIQSIHCLCHRLELAVHDSLKLVAGCNHFEIFVSKLYTLYNQSAKNVRLLEEAAAELNMQLLKIGQIFTIRWVSSSFRTVKAVWNNYPALASHFKVASEDPSRNDTERKKFLGLHKQLSNAGFVADLACMKDMLRELQALSLRLQQRDIDIVSANCQIQQCIDVLSAMKECGGKSAQKAEERITQGLFKGLELVESSALGESASEAVQELRDWKLQDAAPAPGKTLEKLSTASRTYLPTSSECERGFSAVNDTDSKTRNRLREASISSLLFVDLNGPPLERFDPTLFITSWLKSGHRLSTSWASGPRAKAAEPRPLWSLLC
ncbi:E3 SUMO-protein ligase KIAA1586 [Dissostichus eleginoides]|uniref:E3 SUMO-protein ligase KIAA1586 n=1 Tax=Dissostichus eleginoides TaxID=100907 RepID=A0AAD9F9I6_DISEL|nr:E3 SUMO-protein ligase KIAA1586 [Dissostichus eleginoides]